MKTVDARGLRCPMPLVKAKLALEGLPSEEDLVVLATDPEAAIDLAAWAADTGLLFEQGVGEGFDRYVLRRP
jgi:tRNA 2-thiouridine synthesizing protein A